MFRRSGVCGVPNRFSPIGQIDLFKDDSYLIGILVTVNHFF